MKTVDSTEMQTHRTNCMAKESHFFPKNFSIERHCFYQQFFNLPNIHVFPPFSYSFYFSNAIRSPLCCIRFAVVSDCFFLYIIIYVVIIILHLLFPLLVLPLLFLAAFSLSHSPAFPLCVRMLIVRQLFHSLDIFGALSFDALRL